MAHQLDDRGTQLHDRGRPAGAFDIIGGIYAWRDAALPVADTVTTVETVVSPHALALGVS